MTATAEMVLQQIARLLILMSRTVPELHLEVDA